MTLLTRDYVLRDLLIYHLCNKNLVALSLADTSSNACLFSRLNLFSSLQMFWLILALIERFTRSFF